MLGSSGRESPTGPDVPVVFPGRTASYSIGLLPDWPDTTGACPELPGPTASTVGGAEWMRGTYMTNTSVTCVGEK